MSASTKTKDADAARARRCWLLPAVLGLVAVLTAVWFIRAAMWPCGALDGSSGCRSRVALDLDAAGLQAATARVGWVAFDLGPEAETALLAAFGPTAAGRRGVLALFDTQTGALIRLLHAEDFPDDYPGSWNEVVAALSPDGRRAAAMLRGGGDDDAPWPLTIYDTISGAVLHRLPGHGPNCVSMLDFSPDGTKLQCGFTVHDLETGQVSSALDDNRMVLPMYADFPPGARAPDGTVVRSYDLPSGTEIFEANARIFEDNASMHFAPDSIGLLEVWQARHENRGQRWWTPSVFRYLAGVGVWDGQSKTLLRRIYANERYQVSAWARDGGYFGFVSDDFHLTVFRR